MIKQIHYRMSGKTKLSPDASKELRGISDYLHGDFRHGREYKPGDAEISAILSVLSRYGIPIQTEGWRPDPGNALVRTDYIVEESDLVGKQYFRVSGGYAWKGFYDQQRDQIYVDAHPEILESYRWYNSFGMVSGWGWGVSGPELADEVNGMIGAGNLKRCNVFASPDAWGDEIKDLLDWEDVPVDPVYALKSQVEMPALCLPLKIGPTGSSTLDRRPLQKYLNEEEIFPEIGLHYRRSEVDALGPFDVARVREHLNTSTSQIGTGHQDIVISSRFRELLAKHEHYLKLEPVFLVDD